MSNILFGVDIASIVAREIGPGLLDATLTVVTSGDRDVANPTLGQAKTEIQHTGKGFIEDYTDSQKDNTLIQKTDRKVILIANTFEERPVPKTADKITIEGTTYNVVKVKRDPAAATYICQVR